MHSNLRAIVRDIERLLILQSRTSAISLDSLTDNVYEEISEINETEKASEIIYETDGRIRDSLDHRRKSQMMGKNVDSTLDSALATSLATVPVLDVSSLGNLVLLIAKLKSIIRTNSPRLERGMAKAMDDDLRDLLHEGRLSIRQQLMTVARIKQAYGFLQVRSTGPLFDLLK